MKNSFNNLAIIRVVVFFFSLTILYSCIKDNFDFDKLKSTKWNPNFAIPLVYSSLTIQDILTHAGTPDLITYDDDNFATLIYESTLFSITAEDIVKIPSQTFYQNFNLSPVDIPAFNATGTFTINTSQLISFDAGLGVSVDSIFFKSGTFDFFLVSTIKHDASIKITIKDATQQFIQTINMDFNGTSPFTETASFSIAGLKIDMTNSGSAPSSEFIIDYEVTLTNSGEAISSSDEIQLNLSFNDLKFQKVFGYIGQQQLSPDPDTVNITIFNNAQGIGSFTLVDPSIKIVISNSYGLPIAANFDTLMGYNPFQGDYPLTGTGIPNPLNIPTPNANQVGQTIVDSFTVSASNSNIVSLINQQPKYFIYKLSSLSNPNGPGLNFILDSSRFKIDVQVNMPLWGTAKDFTIQDTFNFDFVGIDNIEELALRLYIKNGFPIDVNVQLYFADSNAIVMDSLIIPYQVVMPSAGINVVTGKVNSPQEKTIDMAFTPQRLNTLYNTRKIIVKGEAATTNQGSTNIKIYGDYKLDVKLGAVVKTSIDI
jgi:hypothetical protein